MGDFYFNGSKPTNIYFGSSEVSKLYFGSYLIWEKASPAPQQVTVNWATGSPKDCIVYNCNLPFTYSNSTGAVLKLEDPSYLGSIDNPVAFFYNRTNVGSTDGGSDIVSSYVWSEIFINVEIPPNINYENVYCDFRFDKELIEPTKDLSATCTSTTQVVLPITFDELGIRGAYYLYGKTVKVTCQFGFGDSYKQARQNISGSYSGLAEIQGSSTSSATTLITMNSISFDNIGSKSCRIQFQVVRGSAIVGSTFRVNFRATSTATGTYWVFLHSIIIV